MQTLTAISLLALALNAIALVEGCNGTANDKQETIPAPAAHATTSSAEVTKTMETYFQEGLKRPFGPGGPRFELPSSYYEYFASHAGDASQFLEGKFTSTHGAEMMNAYDIVANMGRFPSSRDWALSKMKEAIDGGSPAKYMLQPAYDQLTKQ